MKKRLLITSIVMMLVVAVALSTATYAWFTSNVQVTANSITMTAGTSQSSALGIAWSRGASGSSFNANYTTDIDSVSPELTTSQAGGFQPAAPISLGNAAPTFKTAFIDAQGNFQTDGVDTDVYRFANYVDSTAASNANDVYSNLIHVANLAQSGDQTLYLTANITQHYIATTAQDIADTTHYTYYNASKEAISVTDGEAIGTAGYKLETGKDGTALIRIAVFEVSGSTYTYKGLLSKTAAVDGEDEGDEVDPNTAVGAIGEGDPASDLVTAATVTELNLGTIGAQTDKAYAIYVWLDGAAFDEAQSTKTADIALKFATSSANS